MREEQDTSSSRLSCTMTELGPAHRAGMTPVHAATEQISGRAMSQVQGLRSEVICL